MAAGVAIGFALFCLLILSSGANADETPLTLAGSASSNGGEITIPVPDSGGIYSLTFLRKAGQDLSSINLYASSFIGAQGDAIPIKIQLPGDAKDAPAETRKDIPVSGQLLLLALVIPPLPHSGSYQGTLIVTAPAKDAIVVKITLQRPAIARPATLVVDPKSSSPVQIPQTLTWRHHSWRVLSSSGDTDLSMTLRDKDGSSPVEGIYPVLESVAKAPNGQFAIGRNLTFTFNGVPVWSDLNKGQNADPPAGNPLPANIVAGGHAIVGMHLQDLATGEYDATIRFRAANSTDDDAQKFHFVVDVHAPLIAALAAVLGALLLSFVGTKIVAFKKKSLDLQQRIAALNSVWLKNEQPFVPIVYARAILNQCDELSRRFWLSAADVVEDRLTKVTALIGVLDQARQIRQGIEHIGQSSFVRVRATATLSRVIENMGANCMDDKVLAATKAILDGFADWTKPDHMEAAYWAAFAPWGATLAAAVRLEAISDRAARELMQGLLDRLNSALKEPPSGIDAKVGVETNFAFLKILWDRRRAEAEFNELADKIRTNCDYDDVFKCADDAAWKRVESLGKGKLRILPPESGSAEAYAPITFRVTTGDPELDETVLFKHRLRFQWTIEIAPKTHFWSRGRSRKVPPLTPATYQPEVVQYSPTAGTISATVRVCRGPDETKSDQQDLVISPSSDFRLLRGFETTEMLSFTITGIVAVLTGIMTFYLKNPTFGSLQDYLTIGLWGLSADQTKNALQSYFGISKS